MINTNQALEALYIEGGATASSIAGEVYNQISALSGSFSKWTNGNNVENGDNYAPVPAHLYVPQGYFAKVVANMTVDDWGSIRIVPIDSVDGVDEIPVLNMTSEVSAPGPRGGHRRWQKESMVLLPAGLYDIYVRQDNAVYTGQYAGEAATNLSYCEVSITITYDTIPPTGKCPLLLNAVFSRYTPPAGAVEERTQSEQTENGATSYCSSGYMFRGTLNVHYSDGSIARIPVQTGGWANADSPFKRPNPIPEQFDPYEWPDTACPLCLTAPYSVGDKTVYPGVEKVRTGSTQGYSIAIDETASAEQIENTHVGRTFIKLHMGKRIGSEGCISTIEWYGTGCSPEARLLSENNPLWNELVAGMAVAEDRFSTDIPITIRYIGEQPDYNRLPPNASFVQNGYEE